jgi:hypothetical protein
MLTRIEHESSITFITDSQIKIYPKSWALLPCLDRLCSETGELPNVEYLLSFWGSKLLEVEVSELYQAHSDLILRLFRHQVLDPFDSIGEIPTLILVLRSIDQSLVPDIYKAGMIQSLIALGHRRPISYNQVMKNPAGFKVFRLNGQGIGWKVVKSNGRDLYSGTVQYSKGAILRERWPESLPYQFNRHIGCGPGGFHFVLLPQSLESRQVSADSRRSLIFSFSWAQVLSATPSEWKVQRLEVLDFTPLEPKRIEVLGMPLRVPEDFTLNRCIKLVATHKDIQRFQRDLEREGEPSARDVALLRTLTTNMKDCNVLLSNEGILIIS